MSSAKFLAGSVTMTVCNFFDVSWVTSAQTVTFLFSATRHLWFAWTGFRFPVYSYNRKVNFVSFGGTCLFFHFKWVWVRACKKGFQLSVALAYEMHTGEWPQIALWIFEEYCRVSLWTVRYADGIWSGDLRNIYWPKNFSTVLCYLWDAA